MNRCSFFRFSDYQERHASESREDGAAGLPETDGPTVVLDESTLLVLRDKKLLIEHDWLTMGEILGRGQSNVLDLLLSLSFC